MDPILVFVEIFNNIYLFSLCLIALVILLYLSIKKISIAGYLDPFHFYWTFTFGTAYSVVVGLYFLGYVDFFYLILVFSYGVIFVVSLHLFMSFLNDNSAHSIIKLCTPKFDGNSLTILLMFFYVIFAAYQVYAIGFGAFSEENRFEQARGSGFIVRILGAFVPFIIAKTSIELYKIKSNKKWGIKSIYLTSFLLIFMVFNAYLDGSKAALLFYFYAVVMSIILYRGRIIKIGILKISFVFAITLIFALAVQKVDLNNQKLDSTNAQFLPESFFGIERLLFRIIGNGDKYYLGLPNKVLENIETDNLVVRFVAPLVGSTNLSNLLGYDVNKYTIGKQILLQHDPGREVSGGPTSHFDLFAYKYFGLYTGWSWVLIMTFILSIILKMKFFAVNNVFIASLVTQLWLSTLPILLEPPIGLAKFIDVLMIFMFISLISRSLKGHSSKLQIR